MRMAVGRGSVNSLGCEENLHKPGRKKYMTSVTRENSVWSMAQESILQKEVSHLGSAALGICVTSKVVYGGNNPPMSCRRNRERAIEINPYDFKWR